MAATEDIQQLENQAWKYFSKTNFASKNITTLQKTLSVYLGEQWNEIGRERQEALLDLLHVGDEVRQCFNNNQQLKQRHGSDSQQVQESFPRLINNSEQKINVDFENDLWTWRDEHSGPFSWMSKSQQDLTLADLEPDVISKPQPKTKSLDESENINLAQPQFTFPTNSWCQSVIDGFKKADIDLSASSTSLNSINVEDSTEVEKETNKVAEGSVEDDLHLHTTQSNQHLSGEEDSSDSADRNGDVRERRRKSPSPKKIVRSGSFKKSTSKTSDQIEAKLITSDVSAEISDANKGFSNPVMEAEWSNFVGEAEEPENVVILEPVEKTAPKPQIIDRGEPVAHPSPYQGDRVCLISPSESPLLAGQAVNLAISQTRSEWSSAESTPDHTTHLLKGMQHQQSKPDFKEPLGAIEQFEEDNEVLVVEKSQGEIKVTSETENKRDSDVPITGFDFLDNW